MKRLFKLKRKKSSKPPQQSISPGAPSDIATGSGSFQPAFAAVPEGVLSCSSGDPEPGYSDLTAAPDIAGDNDSPEGVEDKVNEDQGFPPLGPSTSGVAIGGIDFEDEPISERS